MVSFRPPVKMGLVLKESEIYVVFSFSIKQNVVIFVKMFLIKDYISHVY